MKRKLKTWEQFKEEFKQEAKEWHISPSGHITIRHEKINWGIAPEMMKYFGVKIEVEKIGGFNELNSYHGEGWFWHGMAFESNFDDFINEEEMMI